MKDIQEFEQCMEHLRTNNPRSRYLNKEDVLFRAFVEYKNWSSLNKIYRTTWISKDLAKAFIALWDFWTRDDRRKLDDTNKKSYKILSKEFTVLKSSIKQEPTKDLKSVWDWKWRWSKKYEYCVECNKTTFKHYWHWLCIRCNTISKRWIKKTPEQLAAHRERCRRYRNKAKNNSYKNRKNEFDLIMNKIDKWEINLCDEWKNIYNNIKDD